MQSSIPLEEHEQNLFLEWLKLAHPKIWNVTIHIANQRKTTWGFGKRLKKSGVKSGFPDLMIFKPIDPWHGLAIEMKRRHQEKLKKRTSQDEWIKKLNDAGYLACYAFGFDQAKQVLEYYLQGKKFKEYNDDV